MPEPGNIPDQIEKFLTGRTRGENHYKLATREYPFRMGYGPAASEDYLGGRRASQMLDAQSISDAVPRRPADDSDLAFGKPVTDK